jgi:quinol monooxygenase YgiN
MATSRLRGLGSGYDDEEDIVFAVTRLRASGDDGEALPAAVAPLLAALSARPGFRDGELGRSADDPALWALVTRWDGVGSYRRALSAAEVKIAGAPVWVHALDEPGVYLTGEVTGAVGETSRRDRNDMSADAR